MGMIRLCVGKRHESNQQAPLCCVRGKVKEGHTNTHTHTHTHTHTDTHTHTQTHTHTHPPQHTAQHTHTHTHTHTLAAAEGVRLLTRRLKGPSSGLLINH